MHGWACFVSFVILVGIAGWLLSGDNRDPDELL